MGDDPIGGRQLPLFPTPGAPRAETPRVAPVRDLGGDSGLAVAAGAFDEHLARAGRTLHTRRAFASDLRLASRYLGAGRAVASVTTDDLNRFLAWMLEYRDRPCRPKTYARRVTTLKVFFGWLVETGVLERDPSAAIVHRPAEAPLPQVLSDEQVLALRSAAAARRAGRAADPRPELLVRLVLSTGLKKGELVRLRVADLDTAATPPTLLVRYDQPRWRDKERRIPFEPELVPVLEAYLARYRPTDRLFDCTDRNLEYVLAELVAGAGLPLHTGFETLRWTMGVAAYRAGVGPDVLRTCLGLSPITWAETERKLALLASAGPERAR